MIKKDVYQMGFVYSQVAGEVRRQQMERVATVLTRLGVPRTYRGFEATMAAVWLVLEDEECLHMVTKRIYMGAAKLCGQSHSAVERNIRTVVKRAWETNPIYLAEIAGYPMSLQPIPSEFIDALATDALRYTARSKDGVTS